MKDGQLEPQHDIPDGHNVEPTAPQFFPPPGGEELTQSYLPYLEKAVAKHLARRRAKE